MPIVHIRSLALPNTVNMPKLIEQLAIAFAKQANIQLEHISIDWSFTPAGHYFVNKKIYQQQEVHQPPIMVELLIPDTHNEKRQQQLLTVLAEVIHQHSHIAMDNIFISLRIAKSGSIFDNGKVVVWPQKG
ncbi:hypothetical protein [Agarivorans sp.]|uniref:hypothetical protein n=1 Tax=Agarivorans sp. TaxID=1872412 RepID=UPI003D03EB47